MNEPGAWERIMNSIGFSEINGHILRKPGEGGLSEIRDGFAHEMFS